MCGQIYTRDISSHFFVHSLSRVTTGIRSRVETTNDGWDEVARGGNLVWPGDTTGDADQRHDDRAAKGAARGMGCSDPRCGHAHADHAARLAVLPSDGGKPS